MGVGRQSSYLSARKGMLALEAGEARPVPGSRPGRSVLAVTALSAAAILALAACSAGPAASPASPAAAGTSLPTAPAAVTQTLSETGSSLMAPLFARWAPAYHAQFPQVTLRIATSSSGVGISSAAAGATDIGTSDAYLSPADVTKYVHLVNIPLAVAALMVIYHIPDLSPSTHLKLDGQVLAQIFAGPITRWDAPAIRNLNPGVALPSSAIVPVHRSDASGSSFLFTSYLNAQDPADWSPSLIGTTVAWPAQPGGRGADGSDNMISTVGSSPGAIGYVGVSYLAPVRAAGGGGAAAANSGGPHPPPRPAPLGRPLPAAARGPDPGRPGQLHQHAGQRDHLADQRLGRAGLPGHQLRVRHRDHRPAQRHPGTGPACLPQLGPHQRNRAAGTGEFPAAAGLGGDPGPGPDREDHRMTAGAAGRDHPIPAQAGPETRPAAVRAAGVLAARMAAALVHREPGWRLPRRSPLARRYNVSLTEIDAAIGDLARRSLVPALP